MKSYHPVVYFDNIPVSLTSVLNYAINKVNKVK